MLLKTPIEGQLPTYVIRGNSYVPGTTLVMCTKDMSYVEVCFNILMHYFLNEEATGEVGLISLAYMKPKSEHGNAMVVLITTTRNVS
jgi:hypothetical protein